MAVYHDPAPQRGVAGLEVALYRVPGAAGRGWPRAGGDDPEALDLLDRAMQQPHGGNRKVNNVNLDDKPEGNSARQALRKLRDGAPELHAKVLDLLDRALKREPGRPEKSDNVRHKDETAHKAGNSSPYALRKLRDGAPELHAKVLDLLDRAMKREPGRPKTVDIVHGKGERPDGNSANRALRKLRDGAPELHARVRTRTSAAWHRGVEHVPGADAGRVWQSRLE